MYREIDDYEILYMIQENNDYYELILENLLSKYFPIHKSHTNSKIR